MSKKTGRIVVCVAPEVEEHIKQAAHMDGRTASNFMYQLFIEWERERNKSTLMEGNTETSHSLAG